LGRASRGRSTGSWAFGGARGLVRADHVQEGAKVEQWF
jgi:hypothetical protein